MAEQKNPINKIVSKDGTKTFKIGATFEDVLFDEETNYSLKDLYDQLNTYLNSNMFMIYSNKAPKADNVKVWYDTCGKFKEEVQPEPLPPEEDDDTIYYYHITGYLVAKEQESVSQSEYVKSFLDFYTNDYVKEEELTVYENIQDPQNLGSRHTAVTMKNYYNGKNNYTSNTFNLADMEFYFPEELWTIDFPETLSEHMSYEYSIDSNFIGHVEIIRVTKQEFNNRVVKENFDDKKLNTPEEARFHVQGTLTYLNREAMTADESNPYIYEKYNYDFFVTSLEDSSWNYDYQLYEDNENMREYSPEEFTIIKPGREDYREKQYTMLYGHAANQDDIVYDIDVPSLIRDMNNETVYLLILDSLSDILINITEAGEQNFEFSETSNVEGTITVQLLEE